MGIESISLPDILSEEVEALVETGHYSSKSDVVKDALRKLLEARPTLKVSSAIQIYKDGRASLAKCAEIAEVSTIEFKELLAEYGVIRKTKSKDLMRGASLIRKLRK